MAYHNAAPPSALVIGAGIGGLSAAIRLAAAGWRVQVLEQNRVVGGKMGEVRLETPRGSFRWDTGPSVITMRPAFESLFAAAGRRLEDYLILLPVDPLTRYFFPDDTHFDAAHDAGEMAARIEQFSGRRDAEGYLLYLAYAARIHDITAPVFIYNDPPRVGRLAKTPLRDMPAVDPLRTMHGAIRQFVGDDRLRQFLGRFATYVGASPYLAPATLNVIAHVELSGGVWYPQGGIYQIAAAFERLAHELGVEFAFNCPVEKIMVENGRATGVQAGGQIFAADAVIADVDVATVYEKLLGFRTPRARRLVQADVSCSGFILLLGVQGTAPDLAHHNILFSRDYRREFDDIFRRGTPPNDPTIYVAITSKTDPNHAPPGCENWFVLVNAPALDVGDTPHRYDWNAQAAAYRDQVLAKLAERGHDLRGRILAERMLTPVDIERLTGARRGALYGISNNDRFNAFRRPHNRAPDVRGLYFAGGTTHPGGGVPMVTLSGAAAARMVLADHAQLEPPR